VNAADLATIAGAVVSVLVCVGSVLLLAYRIGRLTGTVETRMSFGETDRANIWTAIGALGGKVDRHIEISHR
jgi:hypothetical protein